MGAGRVYGDRAERLGGMRLHQARHAGPRASLGRALQPGQWRAQQQWTLTPRGEQHDTQIAWSLLSGRRATARVLSAPGALGFCFDAKAPGLQPFLPRRKNSSLDFNRRPAKQAPSQRPLKQSFRHRPGLRPSSSSMTVPCASNPAAGSAVSLPPCDAARPVGDYSMVAAQPGGEVACPRKVCWIAW